MARLRRTEVQKADDAFRTALRVREAYLNIRNQRDLSERTGIPQSTLSKKIRDPGSITVSELRDLLEAMDPAEDLIRCLFNMG